MQGRFSIFVINALVEVITGGAGNDSTPPIGIYRSGTKIKSFFMGCGIDMQIGSMKSRTDATTDALREAMNREDGDAVIARVITTVADPRQYIAEPEKGEAVIEHLNRALEADGFTVSIANGKAVLLNREAGSVTVSAIIAKTALLDFDTVQRDVERAQQSIKDDPEDAVTAACSLIESVCRSILIELGLPLPAKKDIEGLIKAVQEPLDLSPGRTDLPAEIQADIRQVLGGLTSVAKGVGSLRTHGGDAHGREKGFRRIDARIARLALHSASTLALFLIETWERKHKRVLPLRDAA